METITTALFEEPFYLYLSLGLIELAMAAIWFKRRSRRVAVMLLAPIALAGAGYTIETLVVTDREQIIADMKQIAREAVSPDGAKPKLETARRCLEKTLLVRISTPGIRKELPRQQALAIARKYIKLVKVTKVRLHRLTVTVNGDNAVAQFTAIFDYHSPELGPQQFRLAWEAIWGLKADGWRIKEVKESYVKSPLLHNAIPTKETTA